MARASNPRRLAAYEPFYSLDPQTGATIEVFYADRLLAESFSARAGWFWWKWQPGFLPDGPPTGPFATSYSAYRASRLRHVALGGTDDPLMSSA